MKEGIWTNGKKTIKGWWRYARTSECFVIELSDGREFEVYGETPEWGNWKLVRS